ncbi:hypothetical protein [Burkholderia gladioli]|uniref:hypothetical protein n=1 Tax=Burkholderia gladioli TaxID=28095 RepID=UPI00164047C1|nr:hypothetical protein [Burkholderia gladioli]
MLLIERGNLLERVLGKPCSKFALLMQSASDGARNLAPRREPHRAKVARKSCDNSADDKHKGIPGAWIALADDQKMYLRWRDEVMLVLMKIPSNAPIQASFPCLKASTSTEHAICGSYQLAAFDQSTEIFKLVVASTNKYQAAFFSW